MPKFIRLYFNCINITYNYNNMSRKFPPNRCPYEYGKRYGHSAFLLLWDCMTGN